MIFLTDMATMLALALLCGSIAGLSAWVCAYDRMFPTSGRREARRQAKKAIPIPFLYFFVLAVLVNFLTPYFIRLGE
ncbi:MAG: hypothetical protein ACT4QG_02800 [Sporichthyaceae bacterium]